MRAKMVGLLEWLEEKDNQLREPYSINLENHTVKCLMMEYLKSGVLLEII